MRAVPVIVVVLAALALAASATAARDPKDPQQKHTAADTKLANSLALRAGDLAAGWKAAPPHPDSPPCTTGPNESKLVQTAKIDPTFIWKDGVTSLGSEVDIFKTQAQAKADWRLSTLKLFRACLLENARSQLGKTFNVQIASAKSLSSPARLADRQLHYQIVFAIKRGSTPLSLVSDVYALGKGRITIVMHSFSVRTPLPSSALKALLQTLSGRLGAGI
jgi:hypothetical protein